MTLPIQVSPYGWGYYLLDLPAATWAWELDITAPDSSMMNRQGIMRTPRVRSHGRDPRQPAKTASARAVTSRARVRVKLIRARWSVARSGARANSLPGG